MGKMANQKCYYFSPSLFIGFFYFRCMKKLKSIRDYLTVVWIISFVARIISKTTHLFEMPTWVVYFTIATILIVIFLSIVIYILEYKGPSGYRSKRARTKY